MRSFAGAVPLVPFTLAMAIVAALFLSSATARALQTSRFVAGLLLFGFGFVLAITLTPDGLAMAGEVSDGVCDVSRVGLAPISELTRISSSSLNVLLFVPLGFAVALLPRTRGAAIVTIAAFSLTFVVEGIQLVVTVLGRGCQTADLVDNLLGLVIGLAAGLLIRPLLRVARPEGFEPPTL